MAFKLLIDGALVEGAAKLEVVNPATARPFEVAPRASLEQLDAAVAAAKRAFPAWSGLARLERRAFLEAFAFAVEVRLEEFSKLLVLEQGKPLPQAQREMRVAIAALRAFGGFEVPAVVLRDTSEERILEQRDPLGVVAAITPWNFPMTLLVLKVAPALALGNTVVAKPAPTTPLTALLLGEVAAAVLPPGVFNVIVDANDLGAALTSHPDVAKVSFTGSTATGRKVMASGASSLKRLTLELGGNDAAIVLDDADIDQVAPRLFLAAMMNAGQVCFAAKRIYAPRPLVGPLGEALARLSSEAIVTDGLEQGAQMGPLQNRLQYDKVLSIIEDSTRQGTVLSGGAALEREGYFIAPTFVGDLPDDARLVCEEQFGPVTPLLAYDSLDEAVSRANDSEYGLGATVWSADYERGISVAGRLQAGTVWVNKHFDIQFDVPIGGAKQSGVGRELGLEGLKEFTQARVIHAAKAAA
ncbi:MAG TPA: aldehyde dehydrogenase family protein [Phenylobacterium sp.]|nr:aldehyde dehydrogenase family protein [Phenylobacterium sp.]